MVFRVLFLLGWPAVTGKQGINTGVSERRGALALGWRGTVRTLLAEAIPIFSSLQVCSSLFIPFTWRMAMTTSWSPKIPALFSHWSNWRGLGSLPRLVQGSLETSLLKFASSQTSPCPMRVSTSPSQVRTGVDKDFILPLSFPPFCKSQEYFSVDAVTCDLGHWWSLLLLPQ